jgi:Protein of unknown function (DUF3040)
VIVPSHNDRGALAEIEQGLYDDDPRFAPRFDTWSVSRGWRWSATLLIAVGIGGAIVGTLTLSGATTLMLGFIPLTAGIALWYLGES